MSSDNQFKHAFAKLRDSYKDRLLSTAEELKFFIDTLENRDTTPEEYDHMLLTVHGLAGTGTTFGFPEISHIASPIDEALRNRTHKPQAMLDLLNHLRDACLSAHKDKTSHKIKPRGFIAKNQKHDFHVLIVDDDKELSQYLFLKLEKRGISSTAAANGTEALNCLTQLKPDMIILDVMMPGMDGHELLNILKNDKKYSSTPILMLTSRKNQKDIGNAFDKGVVDYVAKPFNPDHLLVKIEDILNTAKRRILVIEQDPLIQELITQSYSAHGITTITAAKGLEAWGIIERMSLDLIVIDWMLPNMDAMTIFKRLKESPQASKIPVIVLASKEDDTQNFIEANNKISKPFIPKDLVKRSLALMG